MAFKDTINDTEARTYLESNFFYNLGSSVGYACPNRPNDVRLVQYFLNVYNTGWEGRNLPQLEVDGDFGGKTWRAIKNFQEIDLGFNGHGMVSSINRRFKSPKHGSWYTILILNYSYKFSFPEYWNTPKLDPMFPEELKAHLYSPLPQQV